MTIQINDIIRIQSRMLRNGVDAVQNVWHVKHESGAPVNDALWVTGVAALIDAEFVPLQATFGTNIVSLDMLFFNVTQDVTLPDGTWATFAGGTGVTDTLPPQASPMVFWRTAAARVIGRKFLPPMLESQSNDGVIPGATLAFLATFAANFIGSLIISQGNILFGTFNAITLTFNPYASGFAPVDFRTQRRRRTGVGA